MKQLLSHETTPLPWHNSSLMKQLLSHETTTLSWNNYSLMKQLLSHETAPIPCRERSTTESSGEGSTDALAPAFIFIFFALFHLTFHHSHHNTHRLPLSTFPSNPTFFSISFYPCLSLKLLDKISRRVHLYPNQPLKTLSLPPTS